MSRVVSVITVVAVITLGSESGSARQGSARTAIEAGNKNFSAGVAKGDAAMVAGLYTSDAEAFPPNGDVVRGRAEIQKMWQSVLDSGITGAELSTREVESAGDLAYESGTYVMKTKDGKVADRGKYCVVWKRAQGQWLLHRDIWNTSVPASPSR